MHRHACGHGHYWDCHGSAIRFAETEPTVCMCLDHNVPMEDGDHSHCSIEVLECPIHRFGQADSTGSHLRSEDQVEEGWRPIQMPDNLEEMIQNWSSDPEPNIGWCLLCDAAIRTENDLIPGTNAHNCAAGRVLDAEIRERYALQENPEGTTNND
jgi:hypothetical protein